MKGIILTECIWVTDMLVCLLLEVTSGSKLDIIWMSFD